MSVAINRVSPRAVSDGSIAVACSVRAALCSALLCSARRVRCDGCSRQRHRGGEEGEGRSSECGAASAESNGAQHSDREPTHSTRGDAIDGSDLKTVVPRANETLSEGGNAAAHRCQDFQCTSIVMNSLVRCVCVFDRTKVSGFAIATLLVLTSPDGSIRLRCLSAGRIQWR